jgi:hypothetical protein
MATPFFTQDICLASHRALASSTHGVNRVIFPGGETLRQTARLYVTTNDGAAWFHAKAAGLPNGSGNIIVEAMDALDNPDDFLVVCGGRPGTNAGGLYRTTDGGASFTQCDWYPGTSQSLGTSGFSQVSLARDAKNVNERYLYSRLDYPAPPKGGGLFRSLDRGVTWKQLPWPLLPMDWSDWMGKIVADHTISGSLWLSFPDSAKNAALAHSTDDGATWRVVPGFTNVVDVDALNGHICLYGQMTTDTWNKIYYSSNNGADWSEITRDGYRCGNTISVALDPYRPGRVWICTSGHSVGIFTPAR